MGQLQVLDEAGRLKRVAMRQHEFLVLGRGADRLAQFLLGPSARSTSAIAIALRSLWPKARP